MKSYTYHDVYLGETRRLLQIPVKMPSFFFFLTSTSCFLISFVFRSALWGHPTRQENYNELFPFFFHLWEDLAFGSVQFRLVSIGHVSAVLRLTPSLDQQSLFY